MLVLDLSHFAHLVIETEIHKGCVSQFFWHQLLLSWNIRKLAVFKATIYIVCEETDYENMLPRIAEETLKLLTIPDHSIVLLKYHSKFVQEFIIRIQIIATTYSQPINLCIVDLNELNII